MKYRYATYNRHYVGLLVNIGLLFFVELFRGNIHACPISRILVYSSWQFGRFAWIHVGFTFWGSYISKSGAKSIKSERVVAQPEISPIEI